MAKKKKSNDVLKKIIVYILLIFIAGTVIINLIYAKPILLLIPIVIAALFVFTLYKKKVAQKKKDLELLQRTKTVNDLYREFASNPHGFEEYIAKIYSYMGYQTEVTKGSNDGGKDIVMTKDGAKYVVEVKLYGNYDKIGREKIQKLHSAQIVEGADYAIFVTTSSFTDPAIEYARNVGMTLVDSVELVKMINSIQASI